MIVPGGCRVIDARGQYVLPGGVDPHTRFGFPSLGTVSCDDFYSGTRAAISGGTTTVLDLVVPDSPTGNLLAAYDKARAKADGQACCDYGLHVVIPGYKEGASEKEIEKLVNERGVNSFECFMAFSKYPEHCLEINKCSSNLISAFCGLLLSDGLRLNDSELLAVFEACKRLGALAMVHAENGEVIEHLQRKVLKMGISGPEGHLYSRPEQVEAEATQRAITIATATNCPLYLVNVTSKSAAETIARERANSNCIVYGEGLVAAMGTDGTHYLNRCWRHAAAHVTSPPLRADRSTADHLLNLVANETLQTVASDHCTFNSKQKALGADNFTKIPHGVNGVEERMMVLWERGVRAGRLNACQFVAATSANPAKIFNLYPRKGRIAVGSDADLVVWGARNRTIKAETHHSQVDFNIFEGMQVTHCPLVVVCNGKVVLDEEGLHITQGAGRFLPTPPNAQYVYRVIERREKLFPLRVDRSAAALAAAQAQVDGKVATPAVAATTQQQQQSQPSAAQNGSRHVSAEEPVAASHVTNNESAMPHMRATKSGMRNMQDSTFRLT